MPKYISTEKIIETAILIAVSTPQQDEEKTTEYLDELEFLAYTAGAKCLKRFTQKLPYPDPRTYVRSGKLMEIEKYIKENAVNIAIFDDELTPSQIRNIENVLKCKVLDRTNLILDIFAKRARTAQAKLQVELAQLEYLLPRLTRRWTHLERQQGGIGVRGPGEKEIETDRRYIKNRITLLKNKLKIVSKQIATQSKAREKHIRVALIGYTNVGKSTIMNILSKSSVFAENKLFATLDTTVRKVVINDVPFLLSDTVGFIRKLPHQLIESFKSTLEEAKEADILLHVIDVSHPSFEEQIKIVKETLKNIGIINKPTIYIFNKIDAYKYIPKDPYDLTPLKKENIKLEDLQKTWFAKENSPSVFISAINNTNIDELKNVIADMVLKTIKTKFKFKLKNQISSQQYE